MNELTIEEINYILKLLKDDKSKKGKAIYIEVNKKLAKVKSYKNEEEG